MTDNTNKKRPTHIVWQVIGGQEDGSKAFWQRIGVCWAHSKGTGMNVVLEAVPLIGRVVIRERKEDEVVPGDQDTSTDTADTNGDQQ
jgi:hypothetical protein